MFIILERSMLKFLFLFGNICYHVSCLYFNDYEDSTHIKLELTKEEAFMPINTLSKDKEKIVASKNINCDDFPKYVNTCISDAALIYNSSRKVPPMPEKIPEWCSALKHLTNCAMDWNYDCKDVTESHFYVESIQGHEHVVNNVCNDEWFLSRYETLPGCIASIEDPWEKCYTRFKDVVDDKKNTTHAWSHYETHFYLCCARAFFRRCTLELLLETSNNCTNVQAAILQKFSAIVSEGDVHQDCDVNVMYANCPEGDPRPNEVLLSKLVMIDDVENKSSKLLTDWNIFPLYGCLPIINGLRI